VPYHGGRCGNPVQARIEANRKLRKGCHKAIVSGIERKGYNAFLDQLTKMEESDA
jgi:hypothetical protein